MVRRSLGYGASILIAFALLAGTAAAQPLADAAGQGGGEAEGQAHGDYHVDASGALDAAEDTQDETREKLASDARSANDAYTQAKQDAWAKADEAEPPQTSCRCSDIADELDQRGTLEASHADKVEKAANLDTDYVDAGADVGASGQAEAWFQDAFQGVADAFERVADLFGYETQADDEAKGLAEEAIHADDELRSQMLAQLEEDRDLPNLEPRLNGSVAAEHASEVQSSALGHIDGELP